MAKLILNVFSTIILFLTLTQCNQGVTKTEGKTKKGLQYVIHSKNPTAKKAQDGDFLYFFVTVKNHKDSILQKRQEVKAFELKKDPNDKFYELFTQMKKGDSIIVKEPTENITKESNDMIKKNIDQTRKQIDELKSNKEQKMPDGSGKTMPDSTRNQYIKTLERNIMQAEEQMKQENPMLPKGKMITYIFSVTNVFNKEENTKHIEKEQKEATEKQRIENQKNDEKDAKAIKEYLEKNKLKAEKTASGLYYIIEKEGTGENAKAGNTVAVNYKGQLLNGKVFDTSIKEESEKAGLQQPGRTFEPIKFALGQQMVIKGWDEGITLFKKGGKGILLIPSSLAYGARGAGKDIPPFSPLRFDIELVDIVAEAKQEIPKETPKK